eukprot:TRINITY_DN529_c0_g1_i3.p1 TRINITY_DN529_c0_g1~~TRINITY_DN529_c0_g1_i3.p1  ORF type:complete len:435 (+),score=80.50 TRINITY_DN529_c0_g1_i3:162-1466(+)
MPDAYFFFFFFKQKTAYEIIAALIDNEDPNDLGERLTTLREDLKKTNLTEKDDDVLEPQEERIRFYRRVRSLFDTAEVLGWAPARYLHIVSWLGTFREVQVEMEFLRNHTRGLVDSYVENKVYRKMMASAGHDDNHPHTALYRIQVGVQAPADNDANDADFLASWRDPLCLLEEKQHFAEVCLTRRSFRPWFVRLVTHAGITELARNSDSPALAIARAYALYKSQRRAEAAEAYADALRKLDAFCNAVPRPEQRKAISELTLFASFAWEINANNLTDATDRLAESNTFLDRLLPYWTTLRADGHAVTRGGPEDFRAINISQPPTDHAVHFMSGVFAVWLPRLADLFLQDTAEDVNEMHIIVGQQLHSSPTCLSMWSDILLPTLQHRNVLGGEWVWRNCTPHNCGCKVLSREEVQRLADVPAEQFVDDHSELALP